MQKELKKQLEDLSSQISSIETFEELREARSEVRILLSKIEHRLKTAKMVKHNYRG